MDEEIQNVQTNEKEWLLESVLNDSNQMIQVSDLETYTMMYANETARVCTGHAGQPYTGEHCYTYMMGLAEPCPFCPLRQMTDTECQETEVDNGKEIYAVRTKVIEWKGKKAFIEYVWDITDEQFQIFTALSRDYLNIFMINADSGMAKILKLDGYVTTGLEKDRNRQYPYEATCQQYIAERVHPDDQKMMKEALRLEKIIYELSEKPEYVSAYKTLVDGESHYYQFKYMRLENSSYIVAGFQNIDALIMKERHVQETLAAALKAEEKSNRAKSMFLNSMSHDIRTPLNAIIGCTTLAASHTEDAAAMKKYLSRIAAAGNHLLSLVNDILDMNHIESGNVKLESLPVHLPDLIEKLEMILQPSVAEKRLHLTINAENIRHKDVLTDRLRLNQVFLNILSNSVKYTKEDGYIVFRIEELEDAPEGYGHYRFTVRDNGIGMSPEFIGRIFETFSREQTVTVSGIQGSGLGMSIVKHIVDMLGGDIHVTSEKGKGTESVVSLQLRLCDSQLKAKAENEEVVDLAGKKLLLVEDNELNREIAVEILQESGFEIETAEDGTVAVEKMRHAKPGQYDLILMDIQMPVMDGYEATKQIRRFTKPEVANIPIIAMTANAFEEDRNKAFKAGMNGYIAKPIDVAAMMETLRNFLQ